MAAPTNASKWRMAFNPYPANVDNMAAPTNASKWRMGFNPYPANVDNMAAPTNASKWRIGFNSAFKVLTPNLFLSWMIQKEQDTRSLHCMQPNFERRA